MPHCFRYPNCTRPPGTCPFPHVHVASTAPVCSDFGRLGWCDKGVSCPDRHVRECPEFSEKGTCSTKGCRLPHIIRRKAQSGDEEEVEPTPLIGKKRAAPQSVAGISMASGAQISKRPKLDDSDGFLAFDVEANFPTPGGHDDDDDTIQSDVDSDDLDSSEAEEAAFAQASDDD